MSIVLSTNFDEGLNVETVLNYWDEIASSIKPSLDPKVLFLPIDVSRNPKVWPYLTKFDWQPRGEIEARNRYLHEYEPNILRDTYSDEYIWGQTRGTIHTACRLGDNKENPIMVKAIWIQAFVRHLLTIMPSSWEVGTYNLLSEVELLFFQNEAYKVEWHHAMREIIPLSYSKLGVLTRLEPKNVGELIEMAVFSLTLCLSKYKLIEYFPKQGR